MARDSYVYVIGHPSGAKKIGVAANPDQRLVQLNNASPVPLKADYFGRCETEDAYAIEGRVHAILADHRQNGEWFDVSTERAVGAVMQAAEELGCAVAHHDKPATGTRSTKAARLFYFNQPCAVRPALFRLARERLAWSREELATKAGTCVEDIPALESGDPTVRRLYAERVLYALGNAGIDFAEDGLSFETTELDREDGLYWVDIDGTKALAVWVDRCWHIVTTRVFPGLRASLRPVVLGGPFLSGPVLRKRIEP